MAAHACCAVWQVSGLATLNTNPRVVLQMEDMMDIVQSGAVHAIDLRAKQEELRETDQSYIQVSSLPRS